METRWNEQLKDDTVIARFLSSLRLGDVQRHENGAVVPVFSALNHGLDARSVPAHVSRNNPFNLDSTS